jgi:hypothetical protein
MEGNPMRTQRILALLTTLFLVAVLASSPAAARHRSHHPAAHELVTFAAGGCTGGCGSGSTIGPDGALYVTDGPSGRVLRIDRHTGGTTTFASGLPKQSSGVGIGGAMDVVFLRHRAYVLVTLVGSFFGHPRDIDGVYRVNHDGTATAIADIGAWSIAHPPKPAFFIPSGVQYALEAWHGRLLVTDGHHNRVLAVSRHGEIKEVVSFGDIVPTGLEVSGHSVYMTEAGPIPHRPASGKIISFAPADPADPDPRVVASGAPLLVDVESGHHTLYALSQGDWTLPQIPENEGKPASANTGTLLRVQRHGRLVPVIDGLDRPTSMEIVGDTAYVVTLTGKVMKVCHIATGDDDDDDD